MLEGGAGGRGERGGGVAVEKTHEIALAITSDAIAQDQIVHASADVDRINLHVAVVGESRGQIGRGRREQERAADKRAGGGGGWSFDARAARRTVSAGRVEITRPGRCGAVRREGNAGWGTPPAQRRYCVYADAIDRRPKSAHRVRSPFRRRRVVGELGAGLSEFGRGDSGQGAGDAALDGADVEIERRSDLVVGAVEDVAQGEDFAVAGVEFFHAGGDQLGKFRAVFSCAGLGASAAMSSAKVVSFSLPSWQSSESVAWRRRRKKYQ